MRNVGKVVKTANIEQKSWKQELNAFLRNYRSTPHTSTGIAPAEVVFGREIRIKLPDRVISAKPTQIHTKLKQNDEKSKAKMKEYADKKRHAHSRAPQPGDKVLVQQMKKNKVTAPYNHRPYTVETVKGSMITAKRNGHVITRNASHFKPIKIDPDVIIIDEEEDGDPDEWLDGDPDECGNDPGAHIDPNDHTELATEHCDIHARPRWSVRKTGKPAYLKDYI